VGGFVKVVANSQQAEGDATGAAYAAGSQIAAAGGTVSPSVAPNDRHRHQYQHDRRRRRPGPVRVHRRQRPVHGQSTPTRGQRPRSTDYNADTITFFTAWAPATRLFITPTATRLSQPPGGGSLEDGREYAVIARTEDTLSFGNQFKGVSLSNAVPLFTDPTTGVTPAT
jgi:hypothetical protein